MVRSIGTTESDDTCAVVMELVHGETLAYRITRRTHQRGAADPRQTQDSKLRHSETHPDPELNLTRITRTGRLLICHRILSAVVGHPIRSIGQIEDLSQELEPY